MELVSIIMPSYNSAEFIGYSIDSIVSQTYTNWELLITDDCSTDDTVEIVKSYAAKDDRIKLFELESNQGAGASRNRSIQESKGRYISFCDSDDWWKPEKLEVQLKFMKEQNVEVCYSSYIDFFDDVGKKNIVVAKRSLSYKDMTHNDYIGFLTLIYDTKRVGRVYLPLMKKRQDWAMKLLLIQQIGRAYGIIEPLAYYRLRSNSLSRSKFGLIRYNLLVYTDILKYNKLKSYFILLFIFMPKYFYKKALQKLINQ